MAHNVELERRIDGLTGKLGPVAKKSMFGGIGYMVNGNLCFGIHKEWLVLRSSVEEADELMKSKHISPFNITGRTMKGWLMVSADAIKTDDELLGMLRRGFDFARNLPKK